MSCQYDLINYTQQQGRENLRDPFMLVYVWQVKELFSTGGCWDGNMLNELKMLNQLQLLLKMEVFNYSVHSEYPFITKWQNCLSILGSLVLSKCNWICF